MPFDRAEDVDAGVPVVGREGPEDHDADGRTEIDGARVEERVAEPGDERGDPDAGGRRGDRPPTPDGNGGYEQSEADAVGFLTMTADQEVEIRRHAEGRKNGGLAPRVRP